MATRHTVRISRRLDSDSGPRALFASNFFSDAIRDESSFLAPGQRATMTRSGQARLIVLLLSLMSISMDALAQQQREAAGPTEPPRVADSRRNLGPGQPPRAPFVLNAAKQARVDQILKAWEQKTSKIDKFSCDFRRFEYQPQFSGDKPHSMSEGVIHFKAPDRAEFQVKSRRDAGGATEFGEHLEHWICDGTTIYEFDSRQKLLREQRLPLELQGKAITDGPLPFLFGAKVDKIKARYWVREAKALQPGEIWLEIFPKTRQDAANYTQVDVMLAWAMQDDDFLPNGMRIHRLGNKHENFIFTNRKINERGSLLNVLGGGRYRPRTPSGWKRITDGGPSTDKDLHGSSRIDQQPAANRQRNAPR